MLCLDAVVPVYCICLSGAELLRLRSEGIVESPWVRLFHAARKGCQPERAAAALVHSNLSLTVGDALENTPSFSSIRCGVDYDTNPRTFRTTASLAAHAQVSEKAGTKSGLVTMMYVEHL